MGTRSIAQVPPTPATIALNAYIFGYGGHSLVTPHAALKRLWWTDERIKAKVTRPFVVSKLRGEDRGFLNRPLAFGEGLTDDTYMDWILDRAKRLFLVLAEVGVPDQIFGCIDDSWDDDDLPISLDNVRNLDLAIENDEVLNKKFYVTQFLFLLRELRQGSHVDYGPKEHIPMEYVNSLPPAVTLQVWDRVHFPERPEDIYMRRKFALTDKDTSHDLRKSFLRDVRKAQTLAHEHIASVWASYTTGDAGYVLSDFIGEHTLATFIEHRNPAQFQRVRASARPILLCEWMHCVADALASLHQRGAVHTAIRPSNIVIDHSNHIAFADVGSLRTFQRGKKVNKTEIYDYAPPETPLSQAPLSLASSPPISSTGAFNKLRKMSTSTSGSSSASSNGSSTRSNSMCTIATSPTTSPTTARSNSMTTITTTLSPTNKSFSSFRNFSRHLTHSSISSASEAPSSPTTVIRILPKPSIPDPDLLQDLPASSPEMADIYSLGCIFLDIITFMIKGKTNDFVKFRTMRVSSPIANSKRARNDTSFHSAPDRIDEWTDILQDDSERLSEQIFRAVPGLLELVRRMMMQNAALRPSATQLRDRIQEILVGEGGVEALCCANREWEVLPNSNAATEVETDLSADSLSLATELPSTPSRTASECPRSSSGYDEHCSIVCRIASEIESEQSRRRSSASAATAKISSWRKAFSRVS
ncbi:hypothetical protein LTR37_016528 [Vermiconidia calcicola]|uniref:Uncharacterized protein n=1 Tax=Vermiconidia calcicola TaxID=1690605 RepID=A0ACC3MNS8_9PEZI|nr:hypothetical protein LTR37_016528 [Vermiconidia calcicola]